MGSAQIACSLLLWIGGRPEGSLEAGCAPRRVDSGMSTPATESPGGVVSPAGQRQWGRYLAIVVLIPLLFYPLPFFLATSANYEHWATSTWTPMLEYSYSLRGQDADVVIFGDSSAFIGLDPRIINRTLGIRSVVLPDSVGSIPVTGDKPLESYMAQNRPPKLLVLYFSPWDMDFRRIAAFRQFEGQEMMLRHDTWGNIGRFALQQPTELLAYPFRLYSTFGPKMIKAVLHHVDREKEVADALGHADYKEHFAPLTSDCLIPRDYLAKTGTASVQALVQKYTTPQTRVLVYVAPVPACRNAAEETGRPFADVHAEGQKTLPPEEFAADPYYAHVLPQFVPDSTAQLIATLRPLLATAHSDAAGR